MDLIADRKRVDKVSEKELDEIISKGCFADTDTRADLDAKAKDISISETLNVESSGSTKEVRKKDPQTLTVNGKEASTQSDVKAKIAFYEHLSKEHANKFPTESQSPYVSRVSRSKDGLIRTFPNVTEIYKLQRITPTMRDTMKTRMVDSLKFFNSKIERAVKEKEDEGQF